MKNENEVNKQNSDPKPSITYTSRKLELKISLRDEKCVTPSPQTQAIPARPKTPLPKCDNRPIYHEIQYFDSPVTPKHTIHSQTAEKPQTPKTPRALSPCWSSD